MGDEMEVRAGGFGGDVFYRINTMDRINRRGMGEVLF